MNNPIVTPARQSAARVMARVLALAAVCAAALLLLAGPTQPAHSQSMDAAPTATPVVAPEPPLLLEPANEATVTGANSSALGMPTFRWSLPANAVIVHLQVSNTPGFSTLLVDTDSEATSYTPTGVWPDGPYFWRLKAGAGPSNKRVWSEYSALAGFTKDWSAAGTIRPTLLQPPLDAVRSSFLTGDFAWTPVPGAAGYLFEIAVDDQFANVVYRAEALKTQHTPGVRLISGAYFWRAMPFAYATTTANRVYGAPSTAGRFAVDWTAPPLQLTPADDIATPFVPRFQWQAVEGAKSYALQVGTDSGFAALTIDERTANTDFTPPTNLENDHEYFWRVKAIDQNNNETGWSTVRSFRTQWNFAPILLTPRNNQIQLSYPFFSWKPVPGAERYWIQINDRDNFEGTVIANEKIYNVTTYAQSDWNAVPLTGDAYWRVKAIDASNNETPWSATWSFRTDHVVVPNLIYPPFTVDPDLQNLPVHRVPTVAWPVFVWDTAHEWYTIDQNNDGWLDDKDYQWTRGAAYYELTVDDEPGFVPPNNLYITTTHTLAAAPVLDPDHPTRAFSGLADNKLYYWRVQAFRADGSKLGRPDVNHVWQMRYNGTRSELAASAVISPTIPRDGYQAVGAPPVLGWLPVVIGGQPAYNYHVQISRNREFTALVDEAYPQFVNYVPWQGRIDAMPAATYWWRVRAEVNPGVELTPWSEPRSFAVAVDLVAANSNEWDPLESTCRHASLSIL